MSARPTGTRPTGSVAPSGTTVTRPTVSRYCDFYLASLWDWTPSGVLRVNTFLESLNVDRATYRFEPDWNIWQVRCAKEFKSYICRNFCQLLAKIEEEYVEALEANALQLVLPDNNLQDAVLHPDVMIPVSFPKVPVPPSRSGGSEFGAGLGQNDTGGLGHRRPDMVSLTVPDELRDFATIVVWQNLQAKDKDFERITFCSQAARKALESAYGVKIVTDIAQKVIFVGKDGHRSEELLQVKNKLTNLLHEFQNAHRRPKITRHVFFIESTSPYTIDTREIRWLNPVLARSTIIDPWRYPVPEQYAYLDKDAGAFALRACLFEPFKNGFKKQYWSIYGPYAQNVFKGRPPVRRSGFFEGARAAARSRVAKGLVGPGPVSNWLDAVTTAPEDAAPTPAIEVTGAVTPIQEADEDAPIPLNFDPSSKRDLAAIQARGPAPLPGVVAKPQISLLDQQDAILRDPHSILQRAMKPSLRRISVPDPETLVFPAPSSSLEQSTFNGAKSSDSSDKELGMFVGSLGRLLGTMRGRYGWVKLRADIGRFYMYNLAKSGRAVNEELEPANGWLPSDLRQRLEIYHDAFFTKPLSSWGNDADFLGIGPWQPNRRAVFFDFRFQAPWGGGVYLDFVLEVNAEDYTWRIRFRNNTIDVVNVHCLAQHWDFQATLTHDSTLETEHNWSTFARALIDSLEVTPPTLEFQHTFSEAPVACAEFPIIVHDVRARQVCRFIHQNKKTFLYLTRTLPTMDKPSADPAYRKVKGVLAKCTSENPDAGDDPANGEFAQFFEASVSSVRLEELLSQNRSLVPGDQVDWTVQQIEEEGLLAEMYTQAAELVKGIDGVGVECDNGHDLRRREEPPAGEYAW